MSVDSTHLGSGSDVKDYLRTLSRRRWTILLTFAVITSLATTYALLKTPVYSATASVLIPEQQAGTALNVSNSQLPQAQSQQRFLADEQNFAGGDAVRTLAHQDLGYTASVSVGSSATADILTFSASSVSGLRAANTANAYAHAYIDARRQNQVAQYTQQVTALQGSIANLQKEVASLPPGSSQVQALSQAMQTLNQSVQQAQAAAQLSGDYGPSVIKAASAPSSPSSPNTFKDGGIGAAAGLILGIAIALFVDRIDDGIKSRESAERASGGYPVVSLIPNEDDWKDTRAARISIVEDPTSRVAEAYRTLRTSIQFLGLDEPKRVIGVTSSTPGEGKTTAIANLAVSFARTGTSVVVVSGDLRRPRIHEFFGVSNVNGLSTVVSGSCDLDSALITVSGEANLSLLPSGPVPPNPAELLSLDRVREVIDALTVRFDLVLLDCPPTLPVSDTLLLSRLVDGMLVLASANRTSIGQLTRTYELLRQVQAPLLGTVLNRIPDAATRTYGYEYGYYAADYSPTSTNHASAPSTTDDTTISRGDPSALGLPADHMAAVTSSEQEQTDSTLTRALATKTQPHLSSLSGQNQSPALFHLPGDPLPHSEATPRNWEPSPSFTQESTRAVPNRSHDPREATPVDSSARIDHPE